MLTVFLVDTTSAIAYNSFLMGCPGYRPALEPISNSQTGAP